VCSRSPSSVNVISSNLFSKMTLFIRSMPPGSSLLFAPVVEGVEYGGKLPSFGGIWINFREPLDNFLGTPDQFVVRGCQFWRRGNFLSVMSEMLHLNRAREPR